LDSAQEEKQLAKRLEALTKIWGHDSILSQHFRELIEGEKTHIACFCEDFDNAYLWEHYGDRCIELEGSQIGELRDKGIVVALHIEYLDFQEWLEKVRPLAEKAKILADSVSNFNAEIMKSQHQRTPLSSVVVEIYTSLLETKEKQSGKQVYEHEREVRLLIDPRMCFPSEAVRQITTDSGEDCLHLAVHYSAITKLFTSEKLMHPIHYYDGNLENICN
jgi:hypothetical protein